MKVLVCIRQGRDGEINPFDACAYEAALRIPEAEITLLSMGVESTKDFLLSLTRLGAERAILLTDRAFAGADTLATAYTLSLAVNKISPDLIICGRQTLEGDTAQTGPMLAVMIGYNLVTNVMELQVDSDTITCITRTEGEKTVGYPALITVERINNLRLPSIRSKVGLVTVMNASDLGADITRCGLAGSPTKVMKTFENESGLRKCRFIQPQELLEAINKGISKQTSIVHSETCNGPKLNQVFIVGKKPMEFGKCVCDNITVIDSRCDDEIVSILKEKRPDAVLWASDPESKRLAASVAAKLNVGLCADCTELETDGKELFMYRPALSGSVIAKIRCVTSPAMCTVRTSEDNVKDIFVAAGIGVKNEIEEVRRFADSIGAELAATRRAVDNDILPYEMQVGLTGKRVSPPVYIAIGVSGAVHHIAGMKQSGTVIAINPDRNAPIFDYADYGIIGEFSQVYKTFKK